LSPELADRLYTGYPLIFARRPILAVAAGWFDLLDALCRSLQAETSNGGPQVVAQQVKEKFGGLRFYTGLRSDTHWPDAVSALRTRRSSRLREIVLCDRDRWQGQHVTAEMGGVCAVVVGHTPLREVRVRGNVINIDTGAVFRWFGNLTVLDLAAIPVMLAKEDR